MIAFVFPGQGSQKPGMGRAWVDHPSWEIVDDVSQATGRDVAALLLDTDAEELTRTRNAQLATLTTSLIALDALERIGVEPAAVAGHSLGEYTALVAAGCLGLADGARLVAERGEAMQDAADRRAGTMAAVLGLDDDDVEIACARVDGDVWVANANAPGQVVIAGAVEAVGAASAMAKEMGAKKVLPMAVGGAFHTPLMAPARDRLRAMLDTVEFRDPDIAVVANVDACLHRDGAQWRELLGAQLCSPVRWRQSLHTLADLGVVTFVEVGPGSVLTGMAKRTVRDRRLATVSAPGDVDALLQVLHGDEPAGAAAHEGEHLHAVERLVVSPGAGVFEPAADLTPGRALDVGEPIGRVGAVDVRSPFAGMLAGVLALAGERVTPSQPLAWLRTE